MGPDTRAIELIGQDALKPTKRQEVIVSSTLQKIEHLPSEFSNEKIDLLKNTVCRGASNDEFQLFLHVCKKTGLDPFMKQIYSIPRGGQRTIQTSIDGLRLIAERTNRYSPGKECSFVYGEKGEMISATSHIKKMTADGTWHEVSATAYFDEYNQPNSTFWKKMKHVMLAKCAEAIALRKAFPAEMSGVYSDDEMSQTVEAKVVEIKEKEKCISKEQAEDLTEKFSFVTDYRAQVMKSLASMQINSLEELPARLYERVIAGVIRKIEELDQKEESNEEN